MWAWDSQTGPPQEQMGAPNGSVKSKTSKTTWPFWEVWCLRFLPALQWLGFHPQHPETAPTGHSKEEESAGWRPARPALGDCPRQRPLLMPVTHLLPTPKHQEHMLQTHAALGLKPWGTQPPRSSVWLVWGSGHRDRPLEHGGEGKLRDGQSLRQAH